MSNIIPIVTICITLLFFSGCLEPQYTETTIYKEHPILYVRGSDWFGIYQVVYNDNGTITAIDTKLGDFSICNSSTIYIAETTITYANNTLSCSFNATNGMGCIDTQIKYNKICIKDISEIPR